MAIVFIVSAVVVSFDVAGLTVSKAKEMQRHGRSYQHRWAALNAGWHSLLLLTYGTVIHISFNFIDLSLLNWIRDGLSGAVVYLSSLGIKVPFDVEYVARVLALLKEHMRILLGAVTLVVVWVVYNQKIAGMPKSASPNQLTGLAASLFSLLVVCFRLSGSLTRARTLLVDNLQAALVAVDMLALAALLKALGYLDTWWRIISVTLVVLVLVFAIAAVCARLASQLNDGAGVDMQSRWVMITLRLLEPLLIFYFALELVAWVVFRERIHSVGFFFGALALVGGLILKHTFAKIVSCATAEPNGEDEAKFNEAFDKHVRGIGLRTMLSPVLKLIVWIIGGAVGATVILSIVAARAFPTSAADVPSLDGLVTRLVVVCVGVVAAASVVAFLFHDRTWLEDEWRWVGKILRPISKACNWIEERTFRLLHACMESKWTLLFCLLALIVAALVPMYEQVADHAYATMAESAGVEKPQWILRSNHYHGLQIATWLVVASCFALMLSLANRRNQFVKAINEAGGLRGELTQPVRWGRFAITEIACTTLLFGLPRVAEWHDELETRGFHVARFEDTMRAMTAYRNAILKMPPRDLAGVERRARVTSVLCERQFQKKLPSSCRNDRQAADAWHREVGIQVDDLPGRVVVTLTSQGSADGDVHDDIIETICVIMSEEVAKR